MLKYFFLSLSLCWCIDSYGQQVARLYWTDPTYNIIYELKDGRPQPVITDGLGFPWRLASYKNNLFWSNIDKNLIQKSNLDGSDIEDVAVITYPQGIAVDPANGNIYIADTGSPAIIRISSSTGKADSIIIQGLSDPDDLHLDPVHHKLIWLDQTTHVIHAANLDGSNVRTVVADEKYLPVGIALNPANNRIFWTDRKLKAILARDLEGQTTPTKLVEGLNIPESITFDEQDNSLIWADLNDKRIYQYNLDSGEKITLVREEVSGFHVGLLVINP